MSGLLTLDRLGNILLLGLPCLVIGEICGFLGLMECCTIFFFLWLVASTFYLVSTTLRLESAGKAVLVTGCDSGIGHALALHLHQLGFTVFAACLLANKNGEGAESLKELNSDRMLVLQADVNSEEEVRDARKQVDELLPKNTVLWGIVNNAGLGTFGDMEWVPLSTYKKIADVNIFGMINVIKNFLPLIRRSKGRVINMASMLGRMAAPMRSPYVLSKFAVGALSDCLRQEMIPWGVDVIVLEPGNFVAGTQIFTEESIAKNGEEMWNSMSEEARADYGEEFFKSRVEMMKSYVTGGDSDLTSVVEAFSDALLQKYPQARYQPMDLYYKIRIFCAWHLPEWLYDFLYIGPLNK